MNAIPEPDDVRNSEPFDWEKIEASVRKLQARIVKAQQAGRQDATARSNP
ncbi:MAG: reverse transcriptase N-terminal domain-containing protein [Phycisphaerales bacterium]|nr:reverse transcriptase N-terminal domain-containing protein [Phycisphaerales bacterium]